MRIIIPTKRITIWTSSLGIRTYKARSPFPMETLPNFLVSCKSLCSPNTERQLRAPEIDQLAPETSERYPTIKTAKNKKKKRMNIKMIISKNICGLKRHEKKDEFFHHLQWRQPFAALIQETWLTGDENLESEGYTLICSVLPSEKQSRRGSHGVAIALSPQTVISCGLSAMATLLEPLRLCFFGWEARTD